MSGAHRPNRKSSDFTIARILSDDQTDYSTSQNIHPISSYSTLDKQSCFNNQNDAEASEHSPLKIKGNQNSDNLFQTTHTFPENDVTHSSSKNEIHRSDLEMKSNNNLSVFSTAPMTNNLHWLQCTRYQPPKLPRKSFAERVARRRSAAHPRIPFTSYQLQVLEDKYKSGAYLSRKDVVQLSTTLRIPNSRIKIWFQNRRARDRRETRVTCSLPMD